MIKSPHKNLRLNTQTPHKNLQNYLKTNHKFGTDHDLSFDRIT